MQTKRPIIKITKAGWIYILLSIFLGFAAINTGNNLIFIIDSALLGFMGISGFFGKKNIENLEISLEFPEEIFACNDFPLKIIIYNKKRFLPSFLIKLQIEGSEKIFFPFIDKNSSETVFIDYKFKKRGINIINFFVISSIFPFSFFIRFNYPKKSIDKLVFPKPLKCPLNIYEDLAEVKSGKDYLDKKGHSNEIYNFRNYEKHDPVKLINWKLSAKLNKLILNEPAEEQAPPVKIYFDKIRIENLEVKLSKITYLVLFFTKNGKNVKLILNSKVYNNTKEILTQLALYK